MKILFTNVGRRTYIIEYALFQKRYYKDLEIHAAESDSSSAALNFDPRVKKHLTPPVLKDETKYINSLFKIVKKYKIKLIIPLADFDLEILAKNNKKFKNFNCKVLLSSNKLIKTLYDKRLTYFFCKKNNIKTPKIYFNSNILKFSKSKKLIKKDRFGSASSGFLKLHEYHKFVINKKSNFIIQEYIDGTELHFDIMNDFEGKFLAACVKKKFIMRTGETDKAETLYEKKYINLAKKISKIFKHVGNLDCDAIKDKKGDLYFVDFNPRFGGGYPFTHMSGYNFIKAVIDLMLKKKPNFLKKPKLIKASKGISMHLLDDNMKSKRNIIIIGAGQLGILVSNILKRQNIFNIMGFVDNDRDKKNKFVNNFKVLGSENYLLKNKKKNISLAIAIGNIKNRELVIKKLINKNFKFPTIIDPSCNISQDAKIGKGTIVSRSSTILNNTEIGEFSIIGTSVNVLHHAKVENNCIIGGGSTIGSNVCIQKNVFVGVGVTFAAKKIMIKSNSFISSGSVVLNSVEARSKMIGNPARLIPPRF